MPHLVLYGNLRTLANAQREMFVCPELGPRDGYGLSFFPPVWPDAVRLRQELAALWP